MKIKDNELHDLIIELNKTSILRNKLNLNLGISFKNSINATLKKLKKEISTAEQDYEKELKKFNEKKFSEDIEKYEAQEEVGDKYDFIVSLNKEMFSIYEMKVINLHKSFEREIVEIIRRAYKVDTYEFYKWEILKAFFESKNIKYADLNGYIETNELRNLSNFIKHEGGELTSKIKKINEFKNEEYLKLENIVSFLNRVETKVHLFIENISKEICDDLYSFDESKMKNIINELKSKMDSSTFEKFKDLLRK